ncbi:MAG: hypothetical protein ABIJ37_01835 [Pseudomonadota bacterium]
MNGKHVIILGATGMVGGCALRICLEHPDVSVVTIIGRNPTRIKHPKLKEVLHNDFMDFKKVFDDLKDHDVALYCLGVYTGSVEEGEFRLITVNYTVAFAKSFRKASPDASFCFLSGQGADQTQQSRMMFARYKGEAEKALLNLGFSRLHIFRPGYIYPVTPREEPNLMYRITRLLYPLLHRIYPNIGVSSEELANAMVHAGLYGTDRHEAPVLENKDIRSLIST